MSRGEGSLHRGTAPLGRGRKEGFGGTLFIYQGGIREEGGAYMKASPNATIFSLLPPIITTGHWEAPAPSQGLSRRPGSPRTWPDGTRPGDRPQHRDLHGNTGKASALPRAVWSQCPHLFLATSREGGTVIVPLLLMKELRHPEGHRPSKNDTVWLSLVGRALQSPPSTFFLW